MKRLSILKKAIAVIMCVCTVILAAGCGADSKTASTKKKKVIRIKRESPASSDVSPADSEGDEQNNDGVNTPDTGNGGGQNGRRVFVYADKIPAQFSGTVTPLYAGMDSATRRNPDRGFRGSTNLDIFVMSLKSEEDMKEYAREIISEGVGEDDQNPGDTTLVMQNYLYLNGFNNRDITENGLKAIEIFFKTQLEMGIKGQPRFCYIFDAKNASVEDATQEITLRHIEQIAEVIPSIKQCIQAFPICFVGAWGEWHSDYYKHDTTEIASAVMEKLVVPNGLYALMRLPKYKNQLKTKTYYDRIGIENDSIFGKVPANTPGISGTGGLDDGSEQWKQLVKEAAYTPQEGELYWNSWLIQNKVNVDGYKTIEQLSEHRFTTLSIHHSYLDMANRDESQIGSWKKLSIMAGWLKAKGITYDPNWFKNADGKNVSRNVFEFIRDHLGYRIAAQKISISGSGKPKSDLQIEMSLKNYGFSAAFNMKSGFALLDDQGAVVSEVLCGEPEKWYNRNPDDYSDYSSPEYSLSCNLKLPEKSGRYRVAFFLKNDGGQYAHLANHVLFINGYNVLHTFDIQ